MSTKGKKTCIARLDTTESWFLSSDTQLKSLSPHSTS
ncbi:hypothetical protein L917_04023 [Phytophthora nicotianae]|nr:hypothetical protein L915_04169 [Phytophthora nicotianae]ETL45851.1 hypothetical protein L916_04123 [Phytophthora nicotianae]ETL99012.1 hypothetical protein L917_04023 [Phytophthora nicotianae]ETM52167.1 hypothetical protein L914_04135 [Phytophthora nicotianae]